MIGRRQDISRDLGAVKKNLQVYQTGAVRGRAQVAENNAKRAIAAIDNWFTDLSKRGISTDMELQYSNFLKNSLEKTMEGLGSAQYEVEYKSIIRGAIKEIEKYERQVRNEAMKSAKNSPSVNAPRPSSPPVVKPKNPQVPPGPPPSYAEVEKEKKLEGAFNEQRAALRNQKNTKSSASSSSAILRSMNMNANKNAEKSVSNYSTAALIGGTRRDDSSGVSQPQRNPGNSWLVGTPKSSLSKLSEGAPMPPERSLRGNVIPPSPPPRSDDTLQLREAAREKATLIGNGIDAVMANLREIGGKSKNISAEYKTKLQTLQKNLEEMSKSYNEINKSIKETGSEASFEPKSFLDKLNKIDKNIKESINSLANVGDGSKNNEKGSRSRLNQGRQPSHVTLLKLYDAASQPRVQTPTTQLREVPKKNR